MEEDMSNKEKEMMEEETVAEHAAAQEEMIEPKRLNMNELIEKGKKGQRRTALSL